MRFYMDVFSGRIAKMYVRDDRSVIFDGEEFSSDEEALKSDPACLWMQSGYAADDREES